MSTFIEHSRKPNLKKWTCPIDGKVLNSRGAPSYLRNKYNISWNKKFLTNPELLVEPSIFHGNTLLYAKILDIFSDIEFADKDLKNFTLEEVYQLIVRIRLNLRNNDRARLAAIFKYIYPVTSSNIIIKRRQ